MKGLAWGVLSAANGAVLALQTEQGNTVHAVIAAFALFTSVMLCWISE